MTDGLLNPQQEQFLALYTNPKSETFANAVQSALKAGYTENYANNITGLMPDWLFENIGDLRRLRKAESILDKTMDMDPVGPDGKVDSALLSNQLKASTLILKGPGKAKYAERTEHTGSGGAPLTIELVNYDNENKPTVQL